MNCHCMHTTVKPQSLAEHVADYEKNKAAQRDEWDRQQVERFFEKADEMCDGTEPHLAIQLMELAWQVKYREISVTDFIERLETLIAKQVQGAELSLLKHIEYLSNGIEKLLEERE